MLKKILHYNLERKLGRGGMGEVWLAIDSRLARPVALKFLDATSRYDDEIRARFTREIKAATALNHPNIVSVFETGNYENRMFLAMEYIEGKTVRRLIDEGEIDRQKAIDILKQTLTGLSAAHQIGIIHRDIKPDNLMVRSDGFVKILDFGLAKMMNQEETVTLTRGIVGTPRYMSPEQATGGKIDASTDVFSTAAVFYEMLTGRPIFEGQNVHQILSAIICPDPPPIIADESKEMTHFLCKALSKDRERRYSDAREMLTDLMALTSGSFRGTTNFYQEDQSVIVMPFYSKEEDKELSEGITDEIINSISMIKGIRVMSRSISNKYRDVDFDLKDIGSELNVKLALTGTLKRRGERARVNVHLVNTRDGFQVWGERFNFEIEDIFDAEEEISSAVSESLALYFSSVKVPDDEEEDVDKTLEKTLVKPPEKSEHKNASLGSTAREQYLNGMYLLSSMREEEVLESIECFKRAIELEPDFSTAHARLSQAYLYCFYGRVAKERDVDFVALAEEAALKALEIDSDDPEAIVAMGLIDVFRLNFIEGREKLEKALALSPNHPEALSWLSCLYTAFGKPELGAIMARKAISRDPRGAMHYTWLAYSLISQGRFMEAIDSLDRAVRIDPRNPYPYALLLFSNVALDRMGEARMLYDYTRTFADDQFTSAIIKGIYLEKIGEETPDFTKEVLEGISIDPDGLRLAADYYALRGNREKMYEMIRASMQIGNLNLPFLDTDPILKPYRNEPEFLQIREEMKRMIEKQDF